MSENSELLQGDEVISVSPDERVLIDHHTFLSDELIGKLSQSVHGINGKLLKKWCFDGVSCKLLTPKRGWRKGKIKISLEFIPDESEMSEPESPLDDIRREMNQS